MSMISAQCDELRKTADELQDVLDNGHNYTCSGFVVMMHHAQQELRGAADTIWELRCKLADMVNQSEEIERLEAENERLREAAERDADVMEALNLSLEESQAENAKLRDAMYTNAGKHALQHMDEDELRIWATQQSEYIEELKELIADVHEALCADKTGMFHRLTLASMEDDMRELGIEVEDDD